MPRLNCPVLLMVLVGLAVGCGPQVMPKGKGASGTLTVPDGEADVGLELINKLAPEQQRFFDWMHQPFDEATVLSKSAAKSSGTIDKVRQEWDKISFALIEKDQRVHHRATLVTNVGELQLTFFMEGAPLHVRNFLALAEIGYFDGAQLRLENGLAMAGTPAGQELYSVRSPATLQPPPIGSLLALTTGEDLSPGTSFAIVLDPPSPAVMKKAVAFAGDFRGQAEDTAEKIKESLTKKPGSVVIERIETSQFTLRLFQAGRPPLPALTPDGRPSTIPAPPSPQETQTPAAATRDLSSAKQAPQEAAQGTKPAKAKKAASPKAPPATPSASTPPVAKKAGGKQQKKTKPADKPKMDVQSTKPAEVKNAASPKAPPATPSASTSPAVKKAGGKQQEKAKPAVKPKEDAP